MKRLVQLLFSVLIIAVSGVYLGTRLFSPGEQLHGKSELSEGHFLLKSSYVRELDSRALLFSAAESLKPHLSPEQWRSWESLAEQADDQKMLSWLEFLISGFDEPRGVITSQDAAYLALDGMLGSLDDPFSRVMDPKAYAEFQGGLESRPFGGVGLHLLRDKNVIEIFSVYPGSPAELAGLKPGFTLLSVGDVSVETVPQAQELLQGEPGTQLRCLFRDGVEMMDLSLTRVELQTRSVSSRLMDGANGGTFCWIKVSGLKEDTALELEQELKELSAVKPLGLVLDLRGNMGGYVKSTLGVASLFLDSGLPVVKVESRVSSEVKATLGINPTDLPLLVLIDYHTASSAEILAGCLQDYERAQLVGKKTFGKGSVQRIHEFDSGGAIKYTTARYLTPKDRVVDSHGLEPDIKLEEEDILAYCRARWAKKK